MAETVLPETENATLPAQDATLPAQDATLPAQDATLPAQDATLPAQDATVPAEDATLPAESFAQATTLLPPSGVAAGEDDTMAAYQTGNEAAADSPDGPEVSLTPETPRRYHYRGGHQSAEIGRGGIGRVLVAMDAHLGREIAVKELLADVAGAEPSLGSGPGSSGSLAPIASRFLREARITAQLEHPNIVPVYELGHRDDGSIYYTMKLVRGRTLSKALKQCHSLENRLALLSHYTNLCHAIAYAHSRGVVHRDIKTENVMVGEFGETVVLDWGLAKVRGQKDLHQKDLKREIKLFKDAGAGKTVDGSALGTPAYMAPEQAEGNLDEIDERSDVWSLGAVLYELLTGRPPFVGKSAWSVIEKVRTESVTPVRELAGNVPPELASIAEKALRRDKTARYASAERLAEEIEAYEAGARVAAYSYSSWELIRRFVSQNKTLSLSVAIVVAVVLVGAIVVLGAYRRAEEARSRESIARKNEHTSRMKAESEVARANQNFAAALLEKAQRLVENREFLKARIYAAAAQKAAESGRPRSKRAAASPTTAATGSKGIDPAIRSALYSTRMFRSVRFLGSVRNPDGPVRALATSPNGQMLATAGNDERIRLWRLKKGHLPVLLKTLSIPSQFLPKKGWISSVAAFKNADVYRLAFSRDNRWLAFSTSRRNWVLLFDAKLMQLKEHLFLPGVDFHVRDMAFSTIGNQLIAVGSFRGKNAKEAKRTSLPLVVWNAGSPSPRERGSGSADATPSKQRRASILRRKGLPLALSPGTADSPLARVGDLKALGISRSGTTVFVSTRRGELLQLAFPSMKLLGRHQASASRMVALNPKDNYIALGTFSGKMKQWSRKKNRIVDTRSCHWGTVNDAKYLPGGKTLVSAGSDGKLIFREAGAFGETERVEWHTDQIERLSMIEKDSVLISGGWDGRIALWKLGKKGYREKPTSSVAYSPKGGLVAYAYSQSKRIELHGRNGQVVRYESPMRQPWHLTLSHDHRYLAGRFYQKGAVVLWRLGDTKPIAVRRLHFTPGLRSYFSPNGKLLAVPYGLGGVTYLDPQTGQEVGKTGGHTSYVLDLSFSPDGKQLASVAWDGTVRLWDVKTRKLIRILRHHPTKLYTVAHSPDGNLLVTGGDDRAMAVYDLTRKAVLKRLPAVESSITIARFSADGSWVAAGTYDGWIHIWATRSWSKLLAFRAQNEFIFNLVFSPDGKSLISSSWRRSRSWPLAGIASQTSPQHLQRNAERDYGARLDGFHLRLFEPTIAHQVDDTPRP